MVIRRRPSTNILIAAIATLVCLAGQSVKLVWYSDRSISTDWCKGSCDGCHAGRIVCDNLLGFSRSPGIWSTPESVDARCLHLEHKGFFV